MKKRDERGAILVLATAGIVVAVVASALSVDLGRLAVEKRTDQKIADLAALDAVRDFTNLQGLATDSALRNGFPLDATHSITAIEGSVVGGVCQGALGSGKVCVTVDSPLKNAFVGGSRTVHARAVAQKRNLGGFTVGSGLANVNTKKSILDPMIGDMIGGTISVANYQGLADGTVAMTALQTQLLAMGLAVGTPDQLLGADLTVAQLFAATGNALVLKGDTVNSDVFCRNSTVLLPVNCNGTSLAAKATAAGTLKLRDLLSVAAGSESAAVASQFNLLQLLTGSAAVINGTNTVSVPAINLGIPGVANVHGSLKLIERPRGYFGPVGAVTGPAQVTTGQADLTVATTLSVLGTVTGTISVHLTAGTANGWLTQVNCINSPRYTVVHVKANAATVAPTAALSVGAIPLTTTITGSAPGGTGDLTFLYPSYPAPSNPPQQSVGTSSLGLTASVANTGNVLTDVTVAALRPIVQQVVSAIDAVVIQPLLDSMGISMGSADVKGLDPVVCGSPSLAG